MFHVKHLAADAVAKAEKGILDSLHCLASLYFGNTVARSEGDYGPSVPLELSSLLPQRKELGCGIEECVQAVCGLGRPRF